MINENDANKIIDELKLGDADAQKIKSMSVEAKLSSLWKNVSSWRKPTPLMESIFPDLQAFVKDESLEHVYRMCDKIGDYDQEKISPGYYPIIRPIISKFTITNADLEFWRDFILHSDNYFHEHFGERFSYFSSLLHDTRTYQCWKAYSGVTEDHSKLLAAIGKKFVVNLWRGDGQSIYVDGKRPVCDSVDETIFKILKWEKTWEGDETPDEVLEKYWLLFDQLPFALKDILTSK